MTMDKYQVCTRDGFADGVLMLMPPNLNWFGARDLCKRFDGRLHIDTSHQSMVTRYVFFYWFSIVHGFYGLASLSPRQH